MSRASPDRDTSYDFYQTPKWCVDVLLQHVTFRGDILDAGCGDGAIMRALHAGGIPTHRLFGVDLVRRADEYPGLFLEADFLEYQGEHRNLVANPPYGGRNNTAQAFVAHAREIVPRGGTVAMLLRLPWFCGGQALHRRGDWIRENKPTRILAFDRRPSFTGDGKSDATDYCWAIWQAGTQPASTSFELVSCR